jgi:hypothetical protein
VRSSPTSHHRSIEIRRENVLSSIGYEIKVSEALNQDKWVIVAKAGGLPLQVEDGVNGRLVEPNDPQGQLLFPLSCSEQLEVT